MSGNIPYIGSKISLITTSDIRYEGILYTLNREESTIAVQNVRSFGTEGRRCPEVPMSNEIYDFIIFRGIDLKDLTVLQGAPERPAPTFVGSEFLDGPCSSLYSHHMMPACEPCSPLPCAPAVLSAAAAMQPRGLGSQAGAPQRPPPASGVFAAAAPFASNAYPGAVPGPGARLVAERPPLGSAHARQPPSPPSHSKGTLVSAPQAPLSSPAYEDTNGVASSSRGTSEEAKASGSRGVEPKERSADGKDQKTRGRGKGNGQKKPLFEVLRFHKRAEEAIVKAMRSQSSAALQPAELRAMSEMSPSVYHFYLDFVNYCCPSHMAQSDEQQWESLCKALKKHFEKEFGAGGAQSQKQPPQPQPQQRPNNTLGDFITIEASSKAVKRGGAKMMTARGGSGRAAGRGTGRGSELRSRDLVDSSIQQESSGALFGGSLEDPSAQQQASSWACPRCTLRNENSLPECAACGTSKQQAALWAEFPPLG